MFSLNFSTPFIKPKQINLFSPLAHLCCISPIKFLISNNLVCVKVGSQLVQPMLAMISELQRRQAELCILLRKKDQEILDYKDSGVRLSRSMVHVMLYFY